jgi:hypothetical protein
MTTKTTGKPPQQPQRAAPSQQVMQQAYQAHTLAQMLYGQLAMSQPWIGQVHTPPSYEPWTGPQFVPWAAPWPPVWGAGPMGPMDHPVPPMTGFHGFPYR